MKGNFKSEQFAIDTNFLCGSDLGEKIDEQIEKTFNGDRQLLE